MTYYTGQLDGYKLRVADIIMEYVANDNLTLKVHQSQKSFLVEDGRPDIHIKVHYGKLPELNLTEKLFDVTNNGGLWALYKNEGTYEITLTSPVAGIEPYRVAIFDTDFSHGDLYIRPTKNSLKIKNGELPCFDAVEYPLDELILVNFLSLGRGVDLHACGVKMGNQGILFSGVSGAGKSTIAEFWKKQDVDLLSDDRIIVRKVDGEFLMYGTPWHGDAKVSVPDKAPLKTIYFLKQSKENQAVQLNIPESTFRLIVRCFPTYYSKEGMGYTLGLVSDIVEKVPCYELQFTPDERAIDTVLCHVESIT